MAKYFVLLVKNTLFIVLKISEEYCDLSLYTVPAFNSQTVVEIGFQRNLNLYLRTVA